MEKWQKDRIQDNLVDLIRNTICSTELITRLRSVLGVSDEESLSTLLPFEKSKLLYKILTTRVGAFNVLLKALEETKQTGALKILKGHSPNYQNYELVVFDKEHILGRGCAGTMVYKGKFDGRDVAVKVLNSVIIDLGKALKEVELLKKLDKHENIIRYHFAEVDNNFIYIAVELLEIDLQDEMKMKVVNLDPITLLRKITAGVHFLHSKNILHRDLKPANILLNRPDVVKITDFGMSKEIPDGATSVTASGAVGTADWMAPEILNILYSEENYNKQHIKMTRSSDVFSLGCIFYYVLSNGAHPFGGLGPRRQDNILNDKPQLTASITKDNWMVLIRKMISHSANHRPAISHILSELTEAPDLPKSSIKPENKSSNTGQAQAERIYHQVVNFERFPSSIPAATEEKIKAASQSQAKTIGAPSPKIYQIINSLTANRMADKPPVVKPSVPPKPVKKTQIEIPLLKEPNNNGPTIRSHLSNQIENKQFTKLPSPDSRLLKQDNNSFPSYQALWSSDVQFQGQVCKLKEIGIEIDDLEDILKTGLHDKEYLHILSNQTKFILTMDAFAPIPPFYISRKLYFGRNYLCVQCTEANFLSHTNESKVVLICDLPGMGKSTLLTSLANQIRESVQKQIVVYINLLNFINKIINQELTYNINPSQILMLIMKQVSTSPLAIDILLKVIKRQKVNIFFDEFDKIPLKHIQLCKNFLKSALHCTLNLTMFIASRLNYKTDLEELFKVNSYSILPFGHADQMLFFSSIWEQKIPNLSRQSQHQTYFQDFAECYLKEIRNQVTSENENICITEIPLLCYQLAEAQIKMWTENRKHFIIDAFLICKEYVDKTMIDQQKTDLDIKDIRRLYIERSLKLLLPKIVYVPKEVNTNINNDELSLKIIDIFKEYFVAEYFSEILTGSWSSSYDTKQIDFFITEYILNFEDITPIHSSKSHPIKPLLICSFKHLSFLYFLDNHLREKSRNSINELLTKSFSCLVSPENLYKIIICCFQNFQFDYLIRIVEKLLLSADKIYLAECRAFLIDALPCDNYFGPKIRYIPNCIVILLVAIHFYSDIRACFRFFKKCFNHDLSVSFAKIPRYVMTPVDLAIKESNTELVKCLLDNGISKESFLCDVVRDTYGKDEKTISSKLEICKILLNWNKTISTETFLFSYEIHLELIKYLVLEGINIYDEYSKNTIVHYALRYMSSDDFYELCHFLVKVESIGLSILKSNLPKWISPLHGLHKFDNSVSKKLQKLVKIFDIPGIDLNEPDEDGNTLLLTAARTSRDPTILKQLIEYGANINVTSNEGQNALHLALNFDSGAISNNFNLETIQYLVSLGIDKNARDINEKTPTELAQMAYEGCKTSAIYEDSDNAVILKSILVFLNKSNPNDDEDEAVTKVNSGKRFLGWLFKKL